LHTFSGRQTSTAPTALLLLCYAVGSPQRTLSGMVMKKRSALWLSAFVCLVTLLAAVSARETQTRTDLTPGSTKTSVPEPLTLLLLGSGLVALTTGRRLARRKQQVSFSSPDKQ